MTTYDRLRELIVSGLVPAGPAMTESDLAQRLSVSRTPVREALRRLEGDGLVQGHSRGVRVAVLSASALADVYRVRAALEALTAESVAVRQADGRLAPADLRSLRRLADAADEVTRSGDLVEGAIRNRAFHRAIAVAADNPVALEMLDRLADRIHVSTSRSLVAPERTDAVHTEHLRIVEGCESGDARGAAQAAREHVLATLASLAQPDTEPGP